jgi:Domain of unknown function (DUF5017)
MVNFKLTKMKKYFLIIAAVILFTACKKFNVDTPTLEVELSKVNYKVGDTVVFNLSGNANEITFYSGEQRFKYENRNRTKAEGIPSFKFLSTQAKIGQLNTLQVLVSSNIASLDSTGVTNATWVDITNRAVLSVGANDVASGTIDLSDFLAQGKPICIAYKYNATTGTEQPSWTIKSFEINSLLTDGSIYNLALHTNADWASISLQNTVARWGAFSTNLFISGGIATAESNLDYVVSKALFLDQVTPDLGIGIKDLGGNVLKTYSYVYKKAGTYKLTFVGINQTPDNRKEVIKEFTITVSP